MGYITNLPVNGLFNITAYFKQSGSLWKDGYHKGIDITSGNKNIYSVCDGEVAVVGWDADGWGRYVSIKPKGFDRIRFIFAHLVKDSVKVKAGQAVSRTSIIGTMGTTGHSTGTHLHIEMRIDNTPVAVYEYLGIENKKQTNLSDKDYITTASESDQLLQKMLNEFDGVSESPKAPDYKALYESEQKAHNETKNELAAVTEKYTTLINKIKELINNG